MRRPPAIDLAAATVLVALGQLEVWRGPVDGPRAWAVATTACLGAAVLGRTVAPLAAVVVASVAGAVGVVAGVRDEGLTYQLVFVLLVGSAGAFLPPRRSLVAAAAAGASLALGVTIVRPAVDGYVWSAVILAVAWTVGWLVGRRRVEAAAEDERAEAARRELSDAAERLVAAERERLAAELQAVVTRGIADLTGELTRAREGLGDDAEATRATLLQAEERGRQALSDLRRLLGLLRAGTDEAPLRHQPSLAALDALVAEARERGVDAGLQIEGTPRPLPLGLDLTAYGLARRMLGAVGDGGVQLVTRYGPEALELEVSGGGPGSGRRARRLAARQLASLRERAASHGGTVELRGEGDRYVLRARLPTVMLLG